MGTTIDLIDRLPLLNELNDKFQSIADINAVVIEQPTVEAIPKDQYEQRLKADMVAVLTDIQLEIEELPFDDESPINITQEYMDEVKSWEYGKKDCIKVIQQKINSLKEA